MSERVSECTSTCYFLFLRERDLALASAVKLDAE